jgi:hypothetical protein
MNAPTGIERDESKLAKRRRLRIVSKHQIEMFSSVITMAIKS